MSLILTGATGLVGSGALNHLLSLPQGQLSRLYILSRRPVPMADNHPNVTVIEHQDFTKYSPELLSQLKGASGCIWALGISQTEVSKEDYVKITVDYPLAAAKAFSTLSPSFNFVYVSGEGATQSPGMFTPFFGGIKGRCEQALIQLSGESPSLKPYSVRPAMVDPTYDPQVLEPFLQRADQKTLPKKLLRGILGPTIRGTYPQAVSPTQDLGRFLNDLASGDGKPLSGDGVTGDGWIISNKAFRRYAGL
ncbi:nucleoside-diphosphate-sugar epimerase [Aspergillus sclerotioniger CBS 115572]|uniref:Nucleoside-diphosphate-sugar epimerase n=1 Tax=Aspergillus sclerotioniger CBS 115572 TaxID=1450535 RepID=A0A317UWX6_9EURO|nr:nucleoside-diphosphate-sugar epimerase [Aspergillus sclerotioniger CBS 115572]PWY66524.1 nucleoside-diphosphate-sugar epimerase [Aspergillus sclerotioniger CBS 115572]